MAGNFDVDWTTTYPFYTLMADFIKVQHNRVGGDFAVAQAVTSRAIRDVIRKTLPDVIFVILNLTKETQRKRVMERHGEGEEADGIAAFLAKMFQLYEGPADDEKNTLKVDITEEMTPEDVQKKVLEILASSGL